MPLLPKAALPLSPNNMDSLDFSEEEIQDQLAILGYTNIPKHRLREFKQDLDELIRHEKSKSQASSSDLLSPKSQTDNSQQSPPAYTKEKVNQYYIRGAGNDHLWHAGKPQYERQVLTSCHNRDYETRQDHYDSYARHSVAPKYPQHLGPTRLEVLPEQTDTQNSYAVSESASPDAGAHVRHFIKRKVLRKHKGQVLVCDESVHSEDSDHIYTPRHECPLVTMYNMYDTQWDEEREDETSSLSSSFWSDGEAEEEIERACYEEDPGPTVTAEDAHRDPSAEDRREQNNQVGVRGEIIRESLKERIEGEGYTASAGSPALSLLTSGYGTYRPDSVGKEEQEGGDYRDDCTIAEFDRESQEGLSEMRDGDDDGSLYNYCEDGRGASDMSEFDGKNQEGLSDVRDGEDDRLLCNYDVDDREATNMPLFDRDRESQEGLPELRDGEEDDRSLSNNGKDGREATDMPQFDRESQKGLSKLRDGEKDHSFSNYCENGRKATDTSEFNRGSQKDLSDVRDGEEDVCSLSNYVRDGMEPTDMPSPEETRPLTVWERSRDKTNIAYCEDDRPHQEVDSRNIADVRSEEDDPRDAEVADKERLTDGKHFEVDSSLAEGKGYKKVAVEVKCLEEETTAEKGTEDELEWEDEEESSSNKDIKFIDSKVDSEYITYSDNMYKEWEGNQRPRKDAVSGLEERLGGLHVSMSVQQDSESENDDISSQSDRHSSEDDGLSNSAFETYIRGMSRTLSEKVLRPRPKSFIRPVLDHPHTRYLKKCDPVSRYFQYKQDWEMFKVPGERDRKALRWEIREQLAYHPPPPKPRRVFVPNTYVVPTDKKRSALRWEIRNDLANGLPPRLNYRF